MSFTSHCQHFEDFAAIIAASLLLTEEPTFRLKDRLGKLTCYILAWGRLQAIIYSLIGGVVQCRTCRFVASARN